MSERSGFIKHGVRIAGGSSLGWALVAVCMAVGASPAWGQCPYEQKLTAFDAAQGDGFGFSVSMSGDTALVGAVGDDDASGSAYVFIRTGGVWALQQKLTASDAAAVDLFGYSVSLSGDTAVIGAYGDDVPAGSAYVFVRAGGVWTQQQKLIASDATPTSNFGWSVSVSGDTAVVGAYADDGSSGSAYVFIRTGGVWAQQQKLTAPVASSAFGVSVSISGDTVVVGAIGDDEAGVNSGAVYVFVRSGGVWTQQQKLTASDATAVDLFGESVSLSGDTALVGAHGDDATGAAYVFVRAGGVWTQQQKLIASDGAGFDYFGISVSVSGDSALVGAFGDDGAAGSTYFFVRSGGVWTQLQKLTASDAAAGDLFGYSVSLSGDTVVIGANGDDHGGGTNSGSAYAFTITNADCNTNGVPDECDIADGASQDCDANSVPDECEQDQDGDGVIDACDVCPLNPDNDADGDGLCAPDDLCPADPNKTAPGVCGCGLAETDSDADGVADCVDQCPDVDDTIYAPGCAGAIPTASAWGLVVLALLLLTGTKVWFARRVSVG